MTQAATPFQILGEEGINELAQTMYQVMDELPEAATIRAMHGENLETISEKLAEFLTGWMGGPPRYSEKYGTVCLTDPHAPYHIGPEERDQWLLCMNTALERVGASEELKAMLKEPMYRLADTVRNQQSSERPPADPNIIAKTR